MPIVIYVVEMLATVQRVVQYSYTYYYTSYINIYTDRKKIVCFLRLLIKDIYLKEHHEVIER